jgi:hypothetical protein
MLFKRKPTLVIQENEPLSEAQINASLAVAPDDSMWVAVLQLINTAEANANRNAQDGMDPPTVLAGYVGGAAHLRMLRDELIDRRQDGIRELGERRLKNEEAREEKD